jgi:hypothetical protein
MRDSYSDVRRIKECVLNEACGDICVLCWGMKYGVKCVLGFIVVLVVLCRRSLSPVSCNLSIY